MHRPLGPHKAHEGAWLEKVEGAKRLVDSSTSEEALPRRGVFVAHAFSGIIGENGRIDPDSQARLASLLRALRGEGFGVHCALEREGWGSELMSPAPALALDLDQVGKADCLVSFPQRSSGTFNELGAMIASPKPTILVKTKPSETENEAISAEELRLMEGTVGLLQDLGVASTMLEDRSTSLGGFEEEVVGPVVAWVGQNA